MRLPAVLAVLLTLSFAGAAPVPKKEALPPFPMTVGDTREYEWKTGHKSEAAHSDSVTKVEAKKDGVTLVTLTRSYTKGETSTSIIAVSPTGLTRVLDPAESPARDPEVLLKLPATIGTKWEANGKKYEVTAEEEVTVGAGTYQTAKVVLSYDTGKTTLWFAPGVGLVKMSYGDGGRELELKSFKPAK